MSKSKHNNIPCFSKWDLEDGSDKDYETLSRILNNRVMEHEKFADPHAGAIILFKAYLPVSRFEGAPSPISESECQNLLEEANNFIASITEEDERDALDVLSHTLRVYIVQKLQGKDEELKKAEENLCIKWNAVDKGNKRFFAHIDATAGYVLTLLGPSKKDEAEKCYRDAISVYDDKASWFTRLGGLISRKNVQDGNSLDLSVKEEKEMFEKALAIDPSTDQARLKLAKLLFTLGNKEDAETHFAQVKDEKVSIIVEKGRFLRKSKRFSEALAVLEKGTQWEYANDELFFQIALIHIERARLAGQSKKWKRRDRLYQEAIQYIDKSLERNPTHFVARLEKAKAYSGMRENEKAEDQFRKVIEESPHIEDRLSAMHDFARFLTIRNHKKVSDEAAELYERIIEDTVNQCASSSEEGNKFIIGDVKRYVQTAKTVLCRFYREDDERSESLKEKLMEFGM